MTGANKIAVAASKVLKATAAEIGAQSLFAAAVGGQAGVTYNRVYYRCVCAVHVCACEVKSWILDLWSLCISAVCV